MIRTVTTAAWFIVAAAAIADDVPRAEHPTPIAMREHWANLNGTWEFRFDKDNAGVSQNWFAPSAAGFDRKIVVPFCWESELSGIKDTTGASKIGWYRRSFRIPDSFPKDQHVWLRFGAVDWEAAVAVNGQQLGTNSGGYTPFEFDITELIKRDADNVVVVRAFDPTDPSLPTGKQVGWYTPTSGIWQTVWLEARPKAYIRGFTTRTESLGEAGADGRVWVGLTIANAPAGESIVTARSSDSSVTPVELKGGTAQSPLGGCSISLGVRAPKLWSPDSPHLYDLRLELRTPDGIVDRVTSYFGLRTIARGKLPGESFERILFNGKPIYLRGALDQSFNAKGIYTAPSDEFLKNDIALAKKMGTNFLRIHIKPEEPRRLYWADKLGMLVMQDMPNTWEQNQKARAAWQSTMREVIARDFNHPSIFSWVAFNETWGLGRPDRYKADKDTQDWVKRMVAEIRKFDPTRLVEDNSPCNYDHVSVTDLNSWHFYIDDHASAKRHIEEVVEKSTPGSSFNHCPGEAMNSAPLINSEYGAVSAGGGDRDVSWGFRDLTTQLRRHPKIQGYIYTELTDIEWEHNGFADYDRGAKVFGYDAFVPNMTPADLQGADFVGYDAPPAIEAKTDELIRVPLFVSHYSQRSEPPTLRWWISGTNGLGERIDLEPRERPVEWVQYSVKEQKPVSFRIKETLVGAMGMELLDASKKRIAANFVNLVVRPEAPAPRVERVDEHTARVRFQPGDYAAGRWTEGHARPPGKAYGRGTGSFIYRLKLPPTVAMAKPVQYTLKFEAAAKGGKEQVDWNSRLNAQDYPQTDARVHPSTLEVTLNGGVVSRSALDDDFADARGVLSHLNRIEHGSHGELVEIAGELPQAARDDLAAGRPLIVRFGVPEDAEAKGGLCIFGADTGAFPFDPTITIRTENDLPADLGVKPDAPIAVETVASKEQWLIRAGDSNQGKASEWTYATENPGRGWNESGFDDSRWKRGAAGFGTPETPALQERTTWNTPNIWLRGRVDVPKLAGGDGLTLHFFHDEDAEIFVNGKRLLRAGGYVTAYQELPLNAAQLALFSEGSNLIAVSCRQTGGGQGIDLGLKLTRDGGD